MLRNLVNTITEMQRNKENDKKEKENSQIGESSRVENKLPLKLEVKFELKSFGEEMDLNILTNGLSKWRPIF